MKTVYRVWGLLMLIFGAHNLLYSQISQSPNPATEGCQVTFTTTLTGTMYYWYFGPNAIVPGDTGANLQSASTYFDKAGPTKVYVTVVTTCCGVEEDSLTVNVQPGALNITLTADTLSTCVGNQIIFTANPTGYSLYSFFINDTLSNVPSAANTFNTSSLAPGDSVTVLGYNGVCYTNPSATLYPVIYPIPAGPGLISSVLSDTICSGDTVTFTATPAGLGMYSFYVGGSLQDSSPSNVYTSDQIYDGNVVSVKVTQNGCLGLSSVKDTFIVNPNPFVQLFPADDTICQGTPVTFTNTSSVTVGATYNFYVNSVDVQDSTLNTYISSAFNNGDIIYTTATAKNCTSAPSNSVRLVVNPIPFVTLTTSVDPSDSICQGSPVAFIANPTTYSQYIFYNGSTVIQNSSLATYTTSTLPIVNSIYVESENLGCTSYSDTISVTVIPAPPVTVGGPQVACLNSPAVTLTDFTPPTGGNWTGAGITSPSGIFTPSVAGVGNHTLTYTYISPTSGCPGDDSIVFTVNALPLIGLDTGESICIGQSVTLTANDGTTYTWSPATGLSSTTVAAPVASPTQTTLYTVIVTNSNNCSDTATNDVMVFPIPTATITATDVCQGTPTAFTATSVPPTGVTYLWYFGDGDISNAQNPTHQYANADSFNVILVVTLGNCPSSDTTDIVVYPTPVANFEANPLVGYNDSSSPITFINRSTNSTIWQWSFGDQSGSNAESPSHVYAQPGAYSVTLIASNQFGCTDSIQSYVTIYPLPKLYIPNVFSPNGDGINDIILVETTGVRYFDWMIFDRWGEKVFESQDVLNGWDGTYKGQKAAMGVYVYYLKVVFDDGSPRDYKGSITLLR